MTVVFLKLHEDVEIPKYETQGSAGLDLKAYLISPGGFEEPIHLKPGQKMAVPTGLKIAMSPSLEGQIRPRSGVSLKTDLVIINSPGTIDSDFRHEIMILVKNNGEKDFTIFHGDRIAQLVFSRIYRPPELIKPVTRVGGFGSTGVNDD